jgi:hypothetical protein
MSDDLVKRLRVDDPWCQPKCNDAADRIEALEAENELLRSAVYIDDLTVTMQANDKTRALAGAGRALGFLDANMPEEARVALRTTLAELTGGKDD